MSDTSDATPDTPRTPLGFPAAQPTTHEAYSFACMRCGHGWEQEYAIEHHTDAEGEPYVVYRADGRQVPSPLTHPKCVNCGHTVVRIMRSGRVSTARGGWLSDVPAAGPLVVPGAYETPRGAMAAAPGSARRDEPAGEEAPGGEAPGENVSEPEPERERRQHRHLRDLVRLLHRERH